jgi:hypothetical protein
MSFAIFRGFHSRRPKDSVDLPESHPGDISGSPRPKSWYSVIRKKRCPRDDKKRLSFEYENDGYQCFDKSSVLTGDDHGPTTYQTHSFQQSLSVRGQPDGIQWNKLTYFMLQSRWGERDRTSKRQMHSEWNFDPDYEESKDDSRYSNHDDIDDEEAVFFDDRPLEAHCMGTRSALFADESKQDDLVGDGILMVDHFQLFARNPIFRSTLED